MYYHLAELETAVRWNVPLVVVVNNNASGNQSRLGFERAYGRDLSEQSRELWTFRDVDIAAVAEEFGAVGRRVRRAGDFAVALDFAVNESRPVVIDVSTDIDALPPA
jgi:acetolactate synthase-1/2/3 large subunit